MGTLRPISALVALAVLVIAAGCGSGGGGGSDNSSPAESSTPTPGATVSAPTHVATPTTGPAPTATTSPEATATPTGGGTDNVQSIVVDPGPNGNYVNGLFTTVTICLPGSATCALVDHVLVDTGSSGLRILSTSLGLALPPQTDPGGAQVAECFPFLDSFTWGPVRVADVVLAGETASSVPMQVIGDPAFAAPPDGCTSSGLPPADTLDKLGARGILGVGVFREDCGGFCAAGNDNIYFSCAASNCVAIAEPLEAQVQNPVALLPQDNNGIVIALPSVPDRGAPSVSGSLTLGIGTQSNNALDGATVLPLSGAGTFTTVFDGQSVTKSFIDTGSNGLFFLDAATTGIPTCAGSADFYCPSSTLSLQATQQGTNAVDVAITFDVGNAAALLANEQAFAYDNLAGPGPHLFDWGLPFFYGRRVLVAIEDRATPAGPGPYIAY